MTRVLVLAAFAAATLAAPLWAQTAAKVKSCGHQANVVAAVQQARLDRIKERDVQAHVLANAAWPENFNTAIPLIAGWVYSKDIKMRDIREKNLAEAWTELCLQQ